VPQREAPGAVCSSSWDTDGLLAHSLTDLIEELSTLARNQLRIGDTNHTFPRLTKPNPIQAKALQLLDIKLSK
jgi:hypothetical protein